MIEIAEVSQSRSRAARLRTVVITGASGGIGRALCEVFRAAEYRVVGTDLTKRHDAQSTFLPADLVEFCHDETYRRRLLAAIKRELPGQRLDVLVNNAAVQILGSCEDLTFDDWQRTMNVNVIAPALLVRGLLGPLNAAHGSVVNVGSVHGSATQAGFAAYASSKAAIGGLSRALAIDLGPHVRVNAVNPGATATPMLKAAFRNGKKFGCRSKPDRLANPRRRTAGSCLN